MLSVGRHLNPALAVQTLNPELLPPHTKLGVFFACKKAASGILMTLSLRETTAWMQEVGRRRTLKPRVPEGRERVYPAMPSVA